MSEAADDTDTSEADRELLDEFAGKPPPDRLPLMLIVSDTSAFAGSLNVVIRRRDDASIRRWSNAVQIETFDDGGRLLASIPLTPTHVGSIHAALGDFLECVRDFAEHEAAIADGGPT